MTQFGRTSVGNTSVLQLITGNLGTEHVRDNRGRATNQGRGALPL